MVRVSYLFPFWQIRHIHIHTILAQHAHNLYSFVDAVFCYYSFITSSVLISRHNLHALEYLRILFKNRKMHGGQRFFCYLNCRQAYSIANKELRTLCYLQSYSNTTVDSIISQALLTWSLSSPVIIVAICLRSKPLRPQFCVSRLYSPLRTNFNHAGFERANEQTNVTSTGFTKKYLLPKKKKNILFCFSVQSFFFLHAKK